jgi:hypothetical protein
MDFRIPCSNFAVFCSPVLPINFHLNQNFWEFWCLVDWLSHLGSAHLTLKRPLGRAEERGSNRASQLNQAGLVQKIPSVWRGCPTSHRLLPTLPSSHRRDQLSLPCSSLSSGLPLAGARSPHPTGGRQGTMPRPNRCHEAGCPAGSRSRTMLPYKSWPWSRPLHPASSRSMPPQCSSLPLNVLLSPAPNLNPFACSSHRLEMHASKTRTGLLFILYSRFSVRKSWTCLQF